MLRACRDELDRLDKAGDPAVSGRRETKFVIQQVPSVFPALVEVAARLAVADADE
jgi:hypothetical protein